MEGESATGVVKTSVSFPRDLYIRGKERAKKQRRRFSAHLQYLIEQDLQAEDRAPRVEEGRQT